MKIQTLKQKLIEQKNKIGLVSGSVNVTEYDEAEHNIAAYITLKGWNINVAIKKGFDPIQDRRQRAYARKKNIVDGLEILVCHMGGLHEPAHWELPLGSGLGCPYDIYNHDLILEAVKRALPGDKQGFASYVTNAFEDTVINPRCREFNGDFSGQILFWDWEGIKCREKTNNGFTPFYEAFVKLNMHLFGDNTDKALLKRHYTGDKKVDKAVKAIVDDIDLPEQVEDTRQLFDKNRWAEMASIFTKHMAPLLDPGPTERLSAFSPQKGEGRTSEGEQESAGNGIEQKLGTREGAEEIAFGRYSSGKPYSPNIEKFDQLDSLYRKLAQPISVKVETMTKKHATEIGPLTHRLYDPEKDDPLKVKPTKLYVNENGVDVGYQRDPLVVNARAKMQRKSFPDFKMIVLDNSGSMREALDGSSNVGNTSMIPWGDRSKYHGALLGLYGIDNFLQHQGIAQYIQHGFSVFSSGTRYQEGGFDKIKDIRKLVLAPEWGSTTIDAHSLRESLQGRESFVLSLSDGEIGNWDSERAAFQELLENQHYAHIQIGGKTQFTADLESWKKPVFYVSKIDELAHLMVDVTKNTYKRFTKT